LYLKKLASHSKAAYQVKNSKKVLEHNPNLNSRRTQDKTPKGAWQAARQPEKNAADRKTNLVLDAVKPKVSLVLNKSGRFAYNQVSDEPNTPELQAKASRAALVSTAKKQSILKQHLQQSRAGEKRVGYSQLSEKPGSAGEIGKAPVPEAGEILPLAGEDQAALKSTRRNLLEEPEGGRDLPEENPGFLRMVGNTFMHRRSSHGNDQRNIFRFVSTMNQDSEESSDSFESQPEVAVDNQSESEEEELSEEEGLPKAEEEGDSAMDESIEMEDPIASMSVADLSCSLAQSLRMVQVASR
jgi:hypothetical protein